MKQTILAILLTLAVNVPANAQSEYLFWTAKVYGAETLAPQARTFSLWVPVNELRIEVATKNEGQQALLVDSGAFVGAVTAELLESGRPVPTRVVWDPTFRGLIENDDIPWATGVQHMLEPDSAIRWTVRLQPGDGALRDGQYTVAIDLRKALQTAFLKPNGGRWIGRAPQRTELTVHVRTPTTANDANRSEQARGRLALKERRYGDALAAFLRAAAAGPPDVGLSADLGFAYLGISAFPDAITWLERALSLSSPAYKSALPGMLALAYVGNGDDVNAARILRSRGKSTEETAREIIRLRGVAKRRL